MKAQKHDELEIPPEVRTAVLSGFDINHYGISPDNLLAVAKVAVEAFRLPAEGAEGNCYRCGGPNPNWYAPSPEWNAVMRGGSIDGPWEFSELICPTCYCILATERGIINTFRVGAKPGRVMVELELTTPSGRVWNPKTDLWESSEGMADVEDIDAQLIELVLAWVDQLEELDDAAYWHIGGEIKKRINETGRAIHKLVKKRRKIVSENRDPICVDAEHKRAGLVRSGDPDGVYASTNTCHNKHCQADAIEWANDITGLHDARFYPDPQS